MRKLQKVQMSDTVCTKGLVKLNVLVRLRKYGKLLCTKILGLGLPVLNNLDGFSRKYRISSQ